MTLGAVRRMCRRRGKFKKTKMRKNRFLKFDDVVKALKEGYKIDRSRKNRGPYNSTMYYIHKINAEIHWKTIEALRRWNYINENYEYTTDRV